MRYLMLIATLFLSVSWATAQSNANPATPTESNEAQTQSGAAAAHAMTVEGCLAGSDGNYTLTDAQGVNYELTGDTSKLAEHIGHEVKVTGRVKHDSGPSSESKTVGTGTAPGPTPISVMSVKHVSKSCKTGMSK